MISRIGIIATTFIVTTAGCVCYTVYMAYQIPESQYCAKRYSINGSSGKKEIWDDQYMFDFKDIPTEKRKE
jgi:hypothetical protein